MEYKKYEFPSFNIYTVKTNRFKTCQVEINFKSQVEKNNILKYTFLADLMSDCGGEYKTRKEVSKKLEEYYQAGFYGITNKTGNLLMTSFILSFLNPAYVNEKSYLENVLKLPFEMILNPCVTSGEFDIKSFNIVKNRLHDEILGTNENISNVALRKALGNLEGDSPSKYSVLGTLEDLENITPKNLAETYQNLIASPCDIFICGNIDMDSIVNIIVKYFKKPIINDKEIPLYTENKLRKKAVNLKEKSKFLETCLVNIYNVKDLTEKERTITMHFYNYLLGGGGLNTKLYQLLREKNSLCYSIKSVYLKYDNLLLIQTTIAKNDIRKASKLINQALKEMKSGDFSEDEINAAKENFVFSLNLALDSPAGILNNYVFHILDNLPLIEDRIKSIKEITKEEIIAVASKIKPNLAFVLESEEEDGNN